MTRPCKIGVQLPEVERFVPWPELIAMAQAAEAVGFDSIWLGDHLLYDLPDGSVRGPWEVFTSLAALAAVTSRVQLGSLVASLGFHEPAMLAKMAATVDSISGGRLILGVGAGWNRREYDAYGFPFDNRVDRFEEAFGIVRRLLAGEIVTHSGAYYTLDRCVIDPPAARPGGPLLMLGSNSPRMLSIGLPHVHQWNVWWNLYGNTPEGFAEVVADRFQGCDQRLAVGTPDGSVEHGRAAVAVMLPPRMIHLERRGLREFAHERGGRGRAAVVGDGQREVERRLSSPRRERALEVGEALKRGDDDAGAGHGTNSKQVRASSCTLPAPREH